MKKIYLLSFLVIAWMFCFGTTTEVFAADEVKIGVVLPMTGFLAPIGLDCKTGLDFALDSINNAGGIKSLDGAKLKIIYTDSTGVQEVGASETERLIIREKVHVLTGAYQSGVTFPGSMIAEKYKIPYIVLVSGRDDITVGRGFKYVFRCSVYCEQQAKEMVNFLTTMNKIHKRKATKIAVVYENSDWGQSITMGFKKHLANTDLRIVLDEPYPAKMPDLTPIVTKIKNVAPDVIIRSQYVSDAIMFTKSLAEMKVDVIGIIGPGGGETDPTFIPAVGEFGEYHLANPTYTPTMPYTRTWLKPINDGFKARYGRDITTVAVHGIINLYLLKDALERAKSTDPQKIRDALAATDIKSYNNPWFLYPMEGIKFDKEGQNIYSVPVMSQILGGELYPVWPKEYQFKEKALVWPMPTWAERKKK